ncbi:CLUMA_CG006685, isoform A [Clunio marinus]|uniref:CLUMA_CG006685, isoform A n=1 Tax=Clunio marinus TaxID=568069 RepID=A0A1J1I038_9DIPT|nr:CLUMA_CG006685, isoform A [Clunio marinus]
MAFEWLLNNKPNPISTLLNIQKSQQTYLKTILNSTQFGKTFLFVNGVHQKRLLHDDSFQVFVQLLQMILLGNGRIDSFCYPKIDLCTANFVKYQEQKK